MSDDPTLGDTKDDPNPADYLTEPGNINLHDRPRVVNADGSVSTVRSMTIDDESGSVNIPTVSEDGRIMSNDEAVDQYRQTGRHLGKYSDTDAAVRAAESLHEDQAAEYAPANWQETARAAGYSWGDINGHIAQASAAAIDEGYTPTQVDRYLGYKDPAPASERFTGGFSQMALDDPQFLSGLAQPEPKIDLTQADFRGDYISALRNREVKGAEDFSDLYAASALTAAHVDGRLDDSEGAARDARLGAAGASANTLAASLPSNADFVDASIALGIPKDNLMRNWRDTGQAPIDAALAARNDPELLQKLSQGPEKPAPFTQGMDEFQDQLKREHPELFEQTKDKIEKVSLGLGLTDADTAATPAEAAARLGIDIATWHALKLAEPYVMYYGGKALRYGIDKLLVLDPEKPVGQAMYTLGRDMLSDVSGELRADPLLHMEAREAALQPKAEVPAEGEAPKRPSYKLVEKEFKPSDGGEPDEEFRQAIKDFKGEITDFDIHKDGEPVGFATLRSPADRPGVAVVDNIATDERAGSMGPRAVRDLAKQFFEENPKVESIEGFRVSGARIQSGEGAGTMTLRRDQVLKEPTPQAVSDLTDGYRAQSGLVGYLKGFAGKLAEDEGGALNLFRTPAQKAERAAFVADRNTMEQGWIERQGLREQTVRQTAADFEPLRKLINPHMKEWTDELAKGPMGAPMSTTIGQMISYVEGRSQGVTLPPNNPLGPVADLIRSGNQMAEGRMQAAEAQGRITVGGYWDDYMRHLWEDPNQAADKFTGMGKLGTNASFKARSYPTIADGLNAGHVPLIKDPIDLTLWDISSKLRYLDAVDQLHDLNGAGLVQFGKPAFGAPAMTALDGGVARLREAYGSEGVARSWNNMVGRGMFNHPVSAGTFETLNYAANLLTAVKLLLPTFHLQTVGIGAVAGGVAQGMEEVARKQFVDAMRTFAGAPFRAVSDAWTGFTKVNPAYLAMSDPAVQDLVRAGLRINRAGTFQEMGRTPSLYQSFARKSLMNELRADVAKIADSNTVWQGAKEASKFAITEAGRVMTLINEPVFGKLIPAMQAGSSYKRMQSWIAANPMATPEARWSQARQIVKDVENRLGELNMDTVFWPQMAKQVAHMSLLSTSWVYGTYRGLAGSLGLNNGARGWGINPTFLAGTVGTVVAYGLANSVAQFLHTGTVPSQTDTPFADLMNYRTGGALTPNGQPRRGMIPSELKEAYDIGGMVAQGWGDKADLLSGAVNYGMGKLNPFWQLARPFISNQLGGMDPIGHHISERPGGWSRWATEQFEPIFMNQVAGGHKGSGLSAFERLLGEKEAPKWVQDWDDYQRGLEGARAKITRDEISRARREESQLEEPSGYDIPAVKGRATGTGSRGGGGQPRSSAPAWGTRQWRQTQ